MVPDQPASALGQAWWAYIIPTAGPPSVLIYREAAVAQLNPLEDSVQFLKGVGSMRAELLAPARRAHRRRSAVSLPALLRGSHRCPPRRSARGRRPANGAGRGRRDRIAASCPTAGKRRQRRHRRRRRTVRGGRLVQPGRGWPGKFRYGQQRRLQRQAEVVSRSLADEQPARAGARRRRRRARPERRARLSAHRRTCARSSCGRSSARLCDRHAEQVVRGPARAALRQQARLSAASPQALRRGPFPEALAAGGLQAGGASSTRSF